MPTKLRVAIDCRITNHQQGVGTAIVALAKALSQTGQGEQEYCFIVRENAAAWLAPYVFGPSRLALAPAPKTSVIKRTLGPITPLKHAWRSVRGALTRIPARPVRLPISDGYAESQEFDLLHFPDPIAYLTSIPCIYQPWDLQHLHYPQFFNRNDLSVRQKYYPAFCEQARFVCVQTEWTKQDVMERLGVPPEKLRVIPWGSVFDAYTAPTSDTCESTKHKFSLPNSFFLYPAATWPHKNHEVLYRALHALKQRGVGTPHVYFTGVATGHKRVLDRLASSLGISDQLHFLGFIEPSELQVLFSSAVAMVFPSRFEGFGLPLLEAFHMRLPLICSDATVLPEVAGDGALYFSPDDPDQLAAKMEQVLNSSTLRNELVRKGTEVLSRHSIQRTAELFQSLYEDVISGLPDRNTTTMA